MNSVSDFKNAASARMYAGLHFCNQRHNYVGVWWSANTCTIEFTPTLPHPTRLHRRPTVSPHNNIGIGQVEGRSITFSCGLYTVLFTNRSYDIVIAHCPRRAVVLPASLKVSFPAALPPTHFISGYHQMRSESTSVRWDCVTVWVDGFGPSLQG